MSLSDAEGQPIFLYERMSRKLNLMNDLAKIKNKIETPGKKTGKNGNFVN
jgi:hypothetical protein